MSETTTEVIEPATDEVAPTVTDPAAPEAPAADAPDSEWKKYARLWESRATENAAAAQRLAAIEEANKTEAQRLQERADKAEKALAERDAADALKKLVDEVADAKKIPASVLRGSTREELEEHADIYLASLPVIPNAPSADGLGAVGGTVTGSDTGLDAAIAAAEAARNFPLVVTLKQQKAAKKG